LKRDDPSVEWSDEVRELGSAARTEFLSSYVSLVRYVAQRMIARLPSSVELEDLVQDGFIGLLDAVEKFDPARGVLFRTYLENRVRGAILDALRKRDWRPRAVRRSQRELDETLARLGAIHGRDVRQEELAEAMGIEISRLHRLLQDANAGPLLSLDELPGAAGSVAPGRTPDAQQQLERRQLLEALAEELTRLPQRERYVLELYYHDGLNMKEVGAVLGVTESRVCQLHAQAAARLRTALRQRMRTPVAAVGAGESSG
jgi:RNA polymerase sigma factor for flagellar operon FliA